MLGDSFHSGRTVTRAKCGRLQAEPLTGYVCRDSGRPYSQSIASKLTQNPPLRDPANQLLGRLLLAPLAPGQLCWEPSC